MATPRWKTGRAATRQQILLETIICQLCGRCRREARQLERQWSIALRRSGPKQVRVTISRPMAGARLRTPRSTDAADEAEDRFSRYGKDRPYCRRQSFPPAGARGSRLPKSSRSRRRSAHSRCGYLAASVLLPCFARVRTWHDTPLQKRHLTGSPSAPRWRS